MNIAIELLWLRPGKVGGTESYTRNLLDGLLKLNDDYEFTLIVAKNTTDTFRKYEKDNRFHILEVDIDNSNIGKRILWQFAHESKFLRKHGIKYCFVPVYCRPIFNGGVKYINVIHDIQAYHYPQYHPAYEVWYSKLMWWCDKLFSKGVICISEFVKNDLIKVYHFNPAKMQVIYDPVEVDAKDIIDFDVLKAKYGIDEYDYYYTVSQLIPHKNLNTVIDAIKLIHDDENKCKLLISGVNGNAREKLEKQLKELNLENSVILTGFVDDSIRNTLYKFCRMFLYPSIFEGFGIPPIEAMMFGAPVLTTKCASIYEVTQGKAYYVDDPLDAKKWKEEMLRNNDINRLSSSFPEYKSDYLAGKVLQYINSLFVH